MNTINKVRAEIERRYNKHKYSTAITEMVYAEEDENILSFLDTLEAEKPVVLELTDEQLDKEVELWYNEYAGNSRFDWIGFARHFAQWGAEHLANSNDEIIINGHKVEYDKEKDAITMDAILNDLEEAAEAEEDRVIEEVEKDDRGCPYISSTHIYNAFVRGAKWDREQMMKEAVEAEGKVVRDINNELAVTAKNVNLDKFKFGDKVRVIVLKKEDEK